MKKDHERDELRAIQEPLKNRYRDEPAAAQIERRREHICDPAHGGR
jgi:hypothetical protein